ncbi:tetratricopeptide repeat protein, partial [Stella sp.]|uniref:tetratricopeptide repeat protein n=1 Tax=Stella sp. TaxID=2912054 RepID=UPI0035B4E80E
MKACRVAALWQVVVVACAIAATTGLPSAARSQGPSSPFVVGTDTLDGTDIAAIRPHMQRLLTVGRPHDPIAFSSGQLTGTVVILRQGRGTDGQVCREVSLAWAKERFIAERLITYCGGTPSWQATRNALQPTLVTPYAEKLLSDLRQRAAETVEEQRQKEYLAAQQREAVSREAEQRQAELQERRDIAARTALIAAVHARLRAQSLQDAPRTDCDVLTAHPDDPLRIADPVERKDRDAERAIPACAAALATYPSSPRLQLQYALALDKAERFEEAVEWYRRAVVRQYPYAIYSLGWAHMRGQGVPKNEGEGARLVREAANYQLSVAENTMGFLFENGRGVKRDPAEAARWYRLAAEQGRAVAQHNLGRLYRDGRGLEQDDVAAVRWLRRAAEQERPAAMFDLGRMLERGRGVAEDVDVAIRFYKMAALRDYQPAEQHLAKLANESEVALRAAREVAEERLSIQAARIEKQREEDARLQEQRDAEARQRREMEARALAAAEAEERRRAHVERVRSEGDPNDILVIFNTRGSDDGKGVERSLSGTLRVADSYEPCIEPALRPKLKRDEDGLGDFLDDRLLSAMGIRSRRFRDCTPTTSSASLFLVSRLGYEGCRPLPCGDLEAIAEFRMAELASWQETKRAERERRRQERLAQLEQERREREEADRVREERRSDRLRLLRSGQAEGYDTV